MSPKPRHKSWKFCVWWHFCPLSRSKKTSLCEQLGNVPQCCVPMACPFWNWSVTTSLYLSRADENCVVLWLTGPQEHIAPKTHETEIRVSTPLTLLLNVSFNKKLRMEGEHARSVNFCYIKVNFFMAHLLPFWRKATNKFWWLHVAVRLVLMLGTELPEWPLVRHRSKGMCGHSIVTISCASTWREAHTVLWCRGTIGSETSFQMILIFQGRLTQCTTFSRILIA